MTTHRTDTMTSRRTAIAGLGASGVGLALGSARPVAAQKAATDAMASHPIVGAWLVTTPIGPSLAVLAADGINVQGVATSQVGPQRVTFTGAQVGTWEPVSERGVHFTSVQLHSDLDCTFVGTVTIDGYPVVSEDGQTITDDSPDGRITIRDATGNVLDVIAPFPGSAPVIGVRMTVGAPGFPEGTPAAATPTL